MYEARNTGRCQLDYIWVKQMFKESYTGITMDQ